MGRFRRIVVVEVAVLFIGSKLLPIPAMILPQSGASGEGTSRERTLTIRSHRSAPSQRLRRHFHLSCYFPHLRNFRRDSAFSLGSCRNDTRWSVFRGQCGIKLFSSVSCTDHSRSTPHLRSIRAEAALRTRRLPSELPMRWLLKQPHSHVIPHVPEIFPTTRIHRIAARIGLVAEHAPLSSLLYRHKVL